MSGNGVGERGDDEGGLRRADVGDRGKKNGHFRRSAQFSACLARPERFERPTPWFVAKYSIQLSYGRVVFLKLRILHSLSSYFK